MMKIETFASGFSGYGGADLGLRAAGLEHTWGLEMEPELAEVYQANIGRCHVQSILDSDPMKLEAVDWLHMSPVCKNFSAAKTNAAEAAFDIDCAKKVAEFIRMLQPKIFTLENVQAYGKSIAFNLIVNELNLCGYWSNWQVLNSADFGVPQSRKRLILRAIKGGFFPSLPPKTKHMGWYEAIADIIPTLKISPLTKSERESLPEQLDFSAPLAVETVGRRSDCPAKVRTGDRPIWTIKALGQDSHWHKFKIIAPDGEKVVDVPCLARLQGFPDDYQFSGVDSRDGKGLGNSVTPPLMTAIARNIMGIAS